MKTTNRFGLSRDIPEQVRHEVRRKSGFGCVLCGCAIVEYHHFDPPFQDAQAHSVEGITALCPTCHTKVEAGRISVAALREGVEHPHPLQIGYSCDQIEVGSLPTVVLGNATFRSVPVIVEVFGRTLLGVSAPELPGEPFCLDAYFYDKEGNPIAEGVRNQWRALVRNWDVETNGARTTIRRDRGDIALVFRTEPPAKVVVERIHMYYAGLRLEGQEGKDLSAYYPDGSLWFRAKGMQVTGCAKGIVL